MRIKYGVIAIGIVLLFVGLSFSPISAESIAQTETKQETYNVEFTAVDENGNLYTEKSEMTEAEFEEFTTTIDSMADEITNAKGIFNVNNIIKKYLLACKYPILFRVYSLIFDLPFNLRGSTNRELVISSGLGYKYNPLKHSKIALYKPLTMWHYSGRSLIRSRTIIVRPNTFDLKMLQGRQIGFMTQFTGIYIYIARQLPQQSYTAFIGFATHAGGIDTTVSPILFR